jgi:CheY-like chemotaxis protein
MDLQMPVMDGLEACRKIRELDSCKDLPVLAMTAHAMLEDRQKCLNAGMNDHVTKPIDPPALFSALMKALRPGESVDGKSAASQKTILPVLPGIDMAAGLARVSGNKKLYKELLEKFTNRYFSANIELTNLLAQQDAEAARRLVHTIKGVSGNIGAMDLFTRADKLETAVCKDLAGLPETLVAGFAEALEQVIGSIRDILQDNLFRQSSDIDKNLFPLSGIDESRLRELVDELGRAIEDDIALALSLIESLAKVVEDSELLRFLDQIEKNLKGYDSDMAMESFGRMIQAMDS